MLILNRTQERKRIDWRPCASRRYRLGIELGKYIRPPFKPHVWRSVRVVAASHGSLGCAILPFLIVGEFSRHGAEIGSICESKHVKMIYLRFVPRLGIELEKKKDRFEIRSRDDKRFRASELETMGSRLECDI
jgi:hypothetical protein